MSIDVKNLTKSFGAFKAVDNVSLHVETGSLTALLGPSGSGKSTLLRMIAGLEVADSGEILLTGEETTSRTARERNVGFVFQHYALFKHMTVRENIAFGLQVRRAPAAEVKRRVEELVDLILLAGLEHRYPSQLSGGQRQRVALARALAPHPRVLLLDEPFGALDAKVREELRRWIRRLHDQTRVTTVFVTHDQHEALEIAGQVLVMNKGRIVQAGAPLDIFDRPATPFVAEFVGESNRVEAPVTEPGVASWGPIRFSVDGAAAGGTVRVFFRPHDVRVGTRPEDGRVEARIHWTRFRGPLVELGMDLGGGREIVAQVPKGVAQAGGLVEGRRVFVDVAAYHVFPSPGTPTDAAHYGVEGMSL